MRKNKKISVLQVVRFLIQIIFFIILPGIYINAFAGIKQIYLSILNQKFSFADNLPQMIEVIAVIPVTIILGRFFCAWMCAFGTLGDMLYHLSSKVIKVKFKMNEKLDSVLKYFKFVLLAFLIIVVWTFNKSIFKGANPWDAFGVLATFGKVPDISYALEEFTVGTVILLGIIIASFFIERFFCRYLCPLGAIFAVVSKLRFVKIKKPSQKCGSCKICTDSCAMGIPLYKYDKISSGECIQCFKCVSACPRTNTSVDIGKENINTGVAAALAVTCMTGLYYGVNAISDSSDAAIVFSENRESESKIYADGTYEGSGTGFRGAVTTVSVTIEKDTIKDIEVVSHGDDAPYFNRSYKAVTSQILSSQSVDVDAVSGATYSSIGIMDAVADAMEKAKVSSKTASSDHSQQVVEEPNDVREAVGGKPKPSSPADENTQSKSESTSPRNKNTQPKPDGISPKGKNRHPKYEGALPKTKNIQPKSEDTLPEAKDTQPKSESTLPETKSTQPKSEGTLPETKNTQPKDTNTSPKAPENTPLNSPLPKYKDGTYEGSARGFRRGITKVSIEIKNDEITDIKVLSHGDDAPYFNSAASVIDEMLQTQSTNVDAVSGATYSSLGIMNAVQNALDQARID